MSKWKTVALPEDIAKQIEKILDKAGYQSLNEFARDACRRRLEELKRIKEEIPAE